MRDHLRRIGVFGGTFDPIHIGHLVAASEVLHAFELDRVMFVPTGQPWQKTALSDAEDRYMMTLLAAQEHSGFVVSRMELDRRGPTYTADTMQELRSFHGHDVELFFIGGADAIAKLETWVGVERLAHLAEVIAVTRQGFHLDAANDAATFPKVHVFETTPVGVSSTDVRRRVSQGWPIDFIVPRDVISYIREHGLYV